MPVLPQARDITIEHRTATGVADLVRQRPAAIIACPPLAVRVEPAFDGYVALVAKAATWDIPIIFAAGCDPVELGLVASLNRPGGNATGVIAPQSEIAEKRLQLLHEAVPAAETIALFVGAVDPVDVPFTRTMPSLAPTQWLDPIETRHTQSAARALGLRLLVFNAVATDLTTVFATLVEHQAGGIVVGGNVNLIPKYAQILSHAARFALPTMFVYSPAARAGGLLSYGQDPSDVTRQMGAYTGRILNGEKPGDLPVQQPTKFEFVINLKTAKTLGLTIPTNLHVRADEVIEWPGRGSSRGSAWRRGQLQCRRSSRRKYSGSGY